MVLIFLLYRHWIMYLICAQTDIKRKEERAQLVAIDIFPLLYAKKGHKYPPQVHSRGGL